MENGVKIKSWVRIILLFLFGIAPSLANNGDLSDSLETNLLILKDLTVPHMSCEKVHLESGQAIEISAHIKRPSQLPDNARLLLEWKLIRADDESLVPRGPSTDDPVRSPDAFGIPTLPTPNWSKLVDAANNTSLAPLDLGDGPAGTRVAGHAAVSLERFQNPRKLQSKQTIRAANFILQSADPGGINAAGPGANVGAGVVFNYTGEVLWSAWKATGDPKYFHGLEDKANRMLEIALRYSDDLGHRVEFFSRYFPKDYVNAVKTVAEKEKLAPEKIKNKLQKAREFSKRINKQIKTDLARLRSIQLEDGGWSFDEFSSTTEAGINCSRLCPPMIPTRSSVIEP